MEIDAGNMCSHQKRKLFEEDGTYHKIWLALQFIALVALCSKVRHQTGMAKMHIRV